MPRAGVFVGGDRQHGPTHRCPAASRGVRAASLSSRGLTGVRLCVSARRVTRRAGVPLGGDRQHAPTRRCPAASRGVRAASLSSRGLTGVRLCVSERRVMSRASVHPCKRASVQRARQRAISGVRLRMQARACVRWSSVRTGSRPDSARVRGVRHRVQTCVRVRCSRQRVWAHERATDGSACKRVSIRRRAWHASNAASTGTGPAH
jgi:hypothetical protein